MCVAVRALLVVLFAVPDSSGDKAVADSVSHVSTGGGSSLVLMEGKLLPAVATLSDIGDNSPPKAELIASLEANDEDEE